jgi:hypothetical protein
MRRQLVGWVLGYLFLGLPILFISWIIWCVVTQTSQSFQPFFIQFSAIFLLVTAFLRAYQALIKVLR